MKDAIAYYRVSTDRQGETKLGLEAQKEAVGAFTSAMLAVIALLAACDKSQSTTTPVVQAPDTVLTATKLVGKWEVTRVEGKLYEGTTLKSTQSWEKDIGYLVDGKPQGREWWPQDVSYICFTDSRYSHTDANGVPDSYMLKDILTPSGRWQSSFNGELSLTRLGDTAVIEPWTYRYKAPHLVMGIAEFDTIGTGVFTNVYTLTFEKQP